jgi:hypothetical protein
LNEEELAEDADGENLRRTAAVNAGSTAKNA